MRILFALCSCLLSGLAAQAPQERPAPESPIRIVLRGEVFVRGHELLLGDLATMHAADPEVVASLETLSLGPAPRGAWARWIDRNQLTELLKSKGITADRLDFRGEMRCQVHAATESIPADELVSSAENVLRALLEDQGETDSTWQLVGQLRPATVPLGRRGRRLVARLTSSELSGSIANFRVDVLVDEERATTVPVQFRVSRYRQLLVAIKPVRSGDPITAANVATQRVETTQMLGTALEHPQQAIGHIAAVPLRPGQIVTDRHLTTPPVVRKGDLVSVIAAVGNIRVATKGIAQEEGRIGERVAVQIGDQKAPIFAEVYGAGLLILRQPSRSRIDLSRIPSTPRR